MKAEDYRRREETDERLNSFYHLPTQTKRIINRGTVNTDTNSVNWTTTFSSPTVIVHRSDKIYVERSFVKIILTFVQFKARLVGLHLIVKLYQNFQT